MKFVEMMTTNDTVTDNGALTNSTSSSFCLDLFFLAGACRRVDKEDIEMSLMKSYSEDRLKTLKIIFWAGDIRQGAGERRFFKIALNWLNKNHPEDFNLNMELVPEYSRWDTLFDIDNDRVIQHICAVLNSKDPSRGLLCKWLPRKVYATDKKVTETKSGNRVSKSVVKTKRLLHNGIATKIMSKLGLTPKQYRKLLVEGTKVVEQKMCAKEWNTINYEQVPSVAMHKYNKAWYRNDGERFTKYLQEVNKGEKKINASAIFPHDIIKQHIMDGDLSEAEITQWSNLPNYLEGKTNSIIPVCDVSGSMWGLPIQICIALGLYISERNIGPFKDAFITFSGRPDFVYLQGNIKERIRQMHRASWGFNTNITDVFQLILEKGIKYHLPQEEMPKTVLIISDMEFDQCGDMSNFEYIKQAYKDSEYRLPNIVFWNVNGRVGNVPVKMNEQGVALISGASPSIIKAVLSNEINPVSIMNKVIESERYTSIK